MRKILVGAVVGVVVAFAVILGLGFGFAETCSAETSSTETNLAETSTRDTVIINSVGDTMIGTLFPTKMLPPEDGWSAFKFSKQYITQGDPDIVFANLEGSLTHYKHTYKNVKSGRSFAFRMPPSYAKIIKDAGFNVVSTANNHAYDFTYQGYKDTRKYLREAGIKYVGNKNEVLEQTINGKKVAIIGFGWGNKFNNILNTTESMAFIRKVAASNDIVIVTFHGGSEGSRAVHVKNEMEYLYGNPRGNLVRFSHKAIDNGADLIIGHGPHLPRAMEMYKGKLIAYSLGNFATYRMFQTYGVRKYTLVLNVELGDNGKFVSGKIIPLIQYPDGIYRGLPKYDPDKNTIKYIKKMTKLDFPSTKLRISDDGIITLAE